MVPARSWCTDHWQSWASEAPTPTGRIWPRLTRGWARPACTCGCVPDKGAVTAEAPLLAETGPCPVLTSPRAPSLEHCRSSCWHSEQDPGPASAPSPRPAPGAQQRLHSVQTQRGHRAGAETPLPAVPRAESQSEEQANKVWMRKEKYIGVKLWEGKALAP